MEGCDLLLTAAQPSEAPLITVPGKWTSFEVANFTIPFNLTGQPALTVCAGFGEHGLPVGAQLIGRPFEDATVLRAGHAYETRRRPPGGRGARRWQGSGMAGQGRRRRRLSAAAAASPRIPTG